MTEEQILKEIALGEKLAKIEKLKNLLAMSDYKAIKYAEGLITDTDYQSIKAEREAYRMEINTLEASL